MELRIPTPEQLREVYRRDMLEAFPAAELKSLAVMEKMWAEGWYKPYCLFDGEDIVGEVFLWLGHPGWSIVDYLCITAARRNDGLGAKIIGLLQEMEPETVFFGEAEAPEHAPDSEMAKRRLGFYARCGLRTACYDTAIFGVHYKTLYFAACEVDEAQLMREHDFIYRNTFDPEKFRKYVCIPYQGGDLAQVAWDQ